MPYLIDSMLEVRRQAYIEYLYKLDGREHRSHYRCGTYTGLLQQRREQLLAADMQLAADGQMLTRV